MLVACCMDGHLATSGQGHCVHRIWLGPHFCMLRAASEAGPCSRQQRQARATVKHSKHVARDCCARKIDAPLHHDMYLLLVLLPGTPNTFWQCLRQPCATVIVAFEKLHRSAERAVRSKIANRSQGVPAQCMLESEVSHNCYCSCRSSISLRSHSERT